MKSLARSEAIAASFRDPSGFLFCHEANILRHKETDNEFSRVLFYNKRTPSI